MTSAVLPPPAVLAADVGAALTAVRSRSPLVQCLTNEVTTGLVANAVLAVGASPAMVSAPGEAEELAGVAGAVLVNLGTLGPDQRECVARAVAVASGAGVPWVLDPVAVGVLTVRSRLATLLLAERPAVVRGNASEVRALAHEPSDARGVDARDLVESAAGAAEGLARATGGAVAVSGPVDLVTDGERRVRLAVGDPLLTRMTGAGCALGGITAAFAAVSGAGTAAVAATAAMGVAAERAATRAAGPGSFAVALLDELAAVTPEDLAGRVRAELAAAVPA